MQWGPTDCRAISRPFLARYKLLIGGSGLNIARTNLNFRDSQDGHLCIRGNEVRPRHSRNLRSISPNTKPPSGVRLNRHPISVEFMVLVVAALTPADAREVIHKLDRPDPLYLLEAQLILAAQTQWRPMDL